MGRSKYETKISIRQESNSSLIADLDLSNLDQYSVEELCGALNDQLLRISEIAQSISEPAASERTHWYLVLNYEGDFTSLDDETAMNQATNASMSEPGHSSNPSNENHVQTTTARLPVISSSTVVTTIIDEPIASTISHEAPDIVNGPKQAWDVRYLSDLVPKQRKKKPTAATTTSSSSVETKEKAIIALLQGIGGERSSIQVRVSELLTRNQNSLQTPKPYD